MLSRVGRHRYDCVGIVEDVLPMLHRAAKLAFKDAE
jgi:hypothetical protein